VFLKTPGSPASPGGPPAIGGRLLGVAEGPRLFLKKA